MTMDLRAKNHPHDLGYNWYGWDYLARMLDGLGVDTSEFKGCNDGHPISEATCKAVADALEKYLPAMSAEDRKWLEPDIQSWRNCGGFEQW
jgi:hypothetical protein